MNAFEAVQGYFESKVFKPFFVVLGDSEYASLRKAVGNQGGVEVLRTSDYCMSSDKRPSLDLLKEALRTIDVSCDSNRAMLVGLGEYLALLGQEEAINCVEGLKDFNLGSAHLAVPVRCLDAQMQEILKQDPRLKTRQIVFIDCPRSEINYQFVQFDSGDEYVDGFQEALKTAEDRFDDEPIKAKTALEFPNAICRVRNLENYFDAAVGIDSQIAALSHLDKEGDSLELWAKLLADLCQYSSLSGVLKEYKIDGSIDRDFYNPSQEQQYRTWLSMLYLLTNGHGANDYLVFAAKGSSNVTQFLDRILFGILDIEESDPLFSRLYQARKEAVACLDESVIARFVRESRRLADGALSRLTDNTRCERREIVALISSYGIPGNINTIFPTLGDYLGKFDFFGSGIDKLLTDYFTEYKRNKVTNTIPADFLSLVDDCAVKRQYNLLDTRDDIVRSIKREGSFLCWIDALGCEYLNFISNRAYQKGLAIEISVGRVTLPSITECNKNFFGEWPSERKKKVSGLDDIKHNGEKSGFSFLQDKTPSYLVDELDVISKVIDDAATSLSLREYDRFVIASDHGASRLAALANKEEKYETSTKGQHSGRCCEYFEGCDLPFAYDTHDSCPTGRYLVLADYGRFKGSKAANVEVHGGASLEEVIVPIVILSLRDSSLKVDVVEKDIKADRNEGIRFTLYVNKALSGELYAVCEGNKHICSLVSPGCYAVEMPEIRRKCEKTVDVFLDDALIGTVPIKVSGKSASINSDFDDLF